jgi:Domain of unknown function (DUF4124)/Bacterial Ig domain
MHLCRIWSALALLVALSGPAQAAVVYRWVDADGVVHFSDQPVPGAEKMVTATGASRGIMGQPTPSSRPAEKPKPASTLAATQLSITSPGPDQTFTGNQPVSVHLSAEPQLKGTHTVTWTLNGAPVNQAPDATEFTLTDLDRGTYSLAATVSDSTTGETKSVDPVTFHVMRPSLSTPQHK